MQSTLRREDAKAQKLWKNLVSSQRHRRDLSLAHVGEFVFKPRRGGLLNCFEKICLMKKVMVIGLVILLTIVPFAYALCRQALADQARERAGLEANLAIEQRLVDNYKLEVQQPRDSLKNCKGR